MLWPPTLRSEATILIEDAEIPEQLVGTLVNDYVEKRLESIDRRVMTTDSLLGIVQRYDLYPKERKTRPFAEVADTMRGDIKREMIRANIVDPKSGQKQQRQRRLHPVLRLWRPRKPRSESPTSWSPSTSTKTCASGVS